MKRLFTACFLLLLVHPRLSAVVDTLDFRGNRLLYHSIRSGDMGKDRDAGPENDRLMIFLHGGVSQFKGAAMPFAPPLEELLEGNAALLPELRRAGYDLIAPVAFYSYNWLEQDGLDFVYALLDKFREQYNKVVIAGFSDGGTGAYRAFYSRPDSFEGLLVFNGYPQLRNFHRQVDYGSVTDKPVIFCSTRKDKRIPYEFLLTEYRRQKMGNPRTYFRLREGDHRFSAYSGTDILECLDLLAKVPEPQQVSNGYRRVYPPVDGEMLGDQLLTYVPFRKSTGKKYGMAAGEYEAQEGLKVLQKALRSGAEVRIFAAELTEADLREKDTLRFTIWIDRQKQEIELRNYLRHPAWP